MPNPFHASFEVDPPLLVGRESVVTRRPSPSWRGSSTTTPCGPIRGSTHPRPRPERPPFLTVSGEDLTALLTLAGERRGREELPLPDCVGQVGHPLRRLCADLLQGHAGRVHTLEQADS